MNPSDWWTAWQSLDRSAQVSWLSAFIGAFVFLGTLVSAYLAYRYREQAQRAQRQAVAAQRKAERAHRRAVEVSEEASRIQRRLHGIAGRQERAEFVEMNQARWDQWLEDDPQSGGGKILVVKNMGPAAATDVRVLINGESADAVAGVTALEGGGEVPAEGHLSYRLDEAFCRARTVTVAVTWVAPDGEERSSSETSLNLRSRVR